MRSRRERLKDTRAEIKYAPDNWIEHNHRYYASQRDEAVSPGQRKFYDEMLSIYDKEIARRKTSPGPIKRRSKKPNKDKPDDSLEQTKALFQEIMELLPEDMF